MTDDAAQAAHHQQAHWTILPLDGSRSPRAQDSDDPVFSRATDQVSFTSLLHGTHGVNTDRRTEPAPGPHVTASVVDSGRSWWRRRAEAAEADPAQ